MIKISADFISQNFTPADFLKNCHEAFLGYGQGIFTMPAREEQVNESGKFTLKMPAVMPGYTGYKFIEELPLDIPGKLGHRTAIIRLKPDTSDEVEMDAEFITNMRTGAAGALGLKYFAPASKNIAILGTGKISKALALCAVELGVETINVYSRSAENREKFKQELAHLDADIVLHDSIASCVSGREAILTAVPTPEPILFYKDLSRSVYISAMGGDARTTQLDREILTRALITPDNEDQCKRSGEFKIALEKCYYKDINFAKVENRVAHIGDAAKGKLKPSADVIIGYFTGLAIQDINAAKMVYEKFILK